MTRRFLWLGLISICALWGCEQGDVEADVGGASDAPRVDGAVDDDAGSGSDAPTDVGPGPGDTGADERVDFASDWTTALGSSEAAITDGGRWPTWAWGGSCTSEPARCDVRIIEDADFPSGRAFAGGYHGNALSTGAPSSGGGNVLIAASERPWPTPDVGQTLFHRFYLKNAIDAPRFGRSLGRGGHHPVEGWDDDPVVGGNCAFHWEYKFDPRADGTFVWEIANLRDRGSWSVSGLALHRVYRMEVGYTRTGENSWQVRARLDGVDQGAIFDGDAEIGEFCLRSMFLGNNDPGHGSDMVDSDPTRWRNYDGAPVPGGPYPDLDTMRWGAVAVAVRDDPDAWIGAYTPARGW